MGRTITEQEQQTASDALDASTTTILASDFIIEGGVLRQYRGTSENVTIPNGVFGIGPLAFFKNGERLTSVTIPNRVTKIYGGAFENCFKLTSVTFESANITFDESNYGSTFPDSLSLINEYKAGGIGTYKKTNGRWTKQ